MSGLLVECGADSGGDRLLSCASPLGEVYVGASRVGVRLIGRGIPPEEFVRSYTERYGCLPSWETDESTRRLANRVSDALFGEKVELLEGEGVSVDELAGHSYLASPGSGGFCYATCTESRKKKPEDLVCFRSVEEARQKPATGRA